MPPLNQVKAKENKKAKRGNEQEQILRWKYEPYFDPTDPHHPPTST
jgi:hypothetical protein